MTERSSRREMDHTTRKCNRFQGGTVPTPAMRCQAPLCRSANLREVCSGKKVKPPTLSLVVERWLWGVFGVRTEERLASA